jgi:DNA repair protein RadC
VKEVLSVNAAACIFFHNHPSSLAEPSDGDRRITTRLIDALKLIDVRVLDHLIVTSRSAYSFAEAGIL